MLIRISDNGPPLYQQIVQQIRHRILAGQLVSGDELPAIRNLAVELRVNPNTIARAYRELEQEGLLEKRRTRGTFVANIGAERVSSDRFELLRPTLEQLLTLAASLGISVDEVIAQIRQHEELLTQPQFTSQGHRNE